MAGSEALPVPTVPASSIRSGLAGLPVSVMHESLADEVAFYSIYWAAFQEAVRDHGIDDRWWPAIWRRVTGRSVL